MGTPVPGELKNATILTGDPVAAAKQKYGVVQGLKLSSGRPWIRLGMQGEWFGEYLCRPMGMDELPALEQYSTRPLQGAPKNRAGQIPVNVYGSLSTEAAFKTGCEAYRVAPTLDELAAQPWRDPKADYIRMYPGHVQRVVRLILDLSGMTEEEEENPPLEESTSY